MICSIAESVALTPMSQALNIVQIAVQLILIKLNDKGEKDMKKNEEKEFDLIAREGKREILIEKSSMQIQSDRIIVYKNMMLK